MERKKRNLKNKKGGKRQRIPRDTSLLGMGQASKSVTERLSFTQVVSVNAAGNIAVNNNIGTENVFNAPFDGFNSCAALYQEYRVKSIYLRIIRGYTSAPLVVATLVGGANSAAPTNTVGAENCNDYLMVGKTLGATAPTTVAQLRQLEGLKVVNVVSPTADDFIVTDREFPNAKLWADTTAVIPAANQMGFVFGSSGAGNLPGSMANALIILSYALVEFRTRL